MLGRGRRGGTRLGRLALTGGAAALLLSACGGDDDDAAPNTTEAPAAEAPASTSGDAPVASTPATAPAVAPTTGGHAEAGDFIRPQELGDVPFVYSNIAPGNSIDPHVAWDTGGIFFARSVYDTLLEYPPGADPPQTVPALATEWTVSDDGVTFTLTLRDDVVFHDGSTFDSADVVASFDRVKALNVGPATMTGNVESVTAAGTHEVVITLATPDVFFDGILPKVPIVSAEAIEANKTADDPWAEDWFAANEAGTGAYTLESMATDRIEFSGFPDYWREFVPGVTPTQVTYRIDPDVTTAVLLMCQGEIDALGGIGPDEAAQADACDGIKQINQARFGVGSAMFRMTADGPTSDVRVRQAIAAAFDYSAWFELFGRQGVESSGPLPATAEIGEVPPVFVQDLERAKQLMSEAGFADGGPDNILFEIEFAGIEGLSFQEFFGNLLTENLKQIGIGVKQTLMPWPQLVEYASGPDSGPELVYLLTNMSSTDPSSILRSQYVTSAFGDGGGYNWGYYSNPEFDAKVAEVSTIVDSAARGALLRELQDILIADQVAIWLTQGTLYQPVSEEWDLLYEPIDFVIVTRPFHAKYVG